MSEHDEYRLTCGARAAGWNWTHPFVKLLATPDRIEIKMPWYPTFLLPRARITSVRPHKGLFSKGILIESSVADAEIIIIWTKDQTVPLDALARLGYPVSKFQAQPKSWRG